jgi:hypothetical protein
MSEPLSKIPSGFRYYSAHEARARRMVETTAMAVFEGWSSVIADQLDLLTPDMCELNSYFRQRLVPTSI